MNLLFRFERNRFIPAPPRGGNAWTVFARPTRFSFGRIPLPISGVIFFYQVCVNIALKITLNVCNYLKKKIGSVKSMTFEIKGAGGISINQNFGCKPN